MTALIRAGCYVEEAHVSWSRWCCFCGRCRSADQLHPFPHGIFAPPPRFECGECGAVTDIIWPSEDMARGVERLLAMRPDPTTRSWFPPETLADLMMENGAHGIFDTLKTAELTPGEILFGVNLDSVKTDRLAEIAGAQRREISG